MARSLDDAEENAREEGYHQAYDFAEIVTDEDVQAAAALAIDLE